MRFPRSGDQPSFRIVVAPLSSLATLIPPRKVGRTCTPAVPQVVFTSTVMVVPAAAVVQLVGVTVAGRAVIALDLPAGAEYRVHAASPPAVWPEIAELIAVPAVPTQPVRVPTSSPPVDVAPPVRERLQVADLLLALASVVVVSAAWVGVPSWTQRRPDDQLFILLSACAGGLAAYLAYGALAAAGRAGPAPAVAAAIVGLIGAACASLAASRRART